MDLTISGFGIAFSVIASVICIWVICWIIALISIIRNDFPGENEKIMWAILLVLLPVIGTILYFAVGARRIKR